MPGCVTAGRSLDEALAFAEEALALHVQGMQEDRETPPAPSGIDDVTADPESAGALFYWFPGILSGRASQVHLTLGGIRAANCSLTKSSGRSDDAS